MVHYVGYWRSIPSRLLGERTYTWSLEVSLESESSEAAILTPTVMLAAVLLARQVMLSVDLSTLKDLQYGYKGA